MSERITLLTACHNRTFVGAADLAVLRDLARDAADATVADRIEGCAVYRRCDNDLGVALEPAVEGERFAREWAAARGVAVAATCTLCDAHARCLVHGAAG